MSDEQNGLFASVDALLEQAAAPDALPVSAERKRLRQAAGLSQDQVAKALDVRRETVTGWEAGRTEPRPPARAAYIRLLDGLADRFPAPQMPSDPASAPRAVPTDISQPDAPAPLVLHAARPAAPTRPVSARPPEDGKTAVVPAATAHFAHGPLAVVDGDGTAYCAGGLVLDCPLTDLPALVGWALGEAKLGAARLHRSGKDADPLIVLTASAVQRLGLPPVLEDRRGLRLPEGHPVLKQLTQAQWKLTKRGFGPWARVYRTAGGARRQCVQFAVLPWGALDARSWGAADQLPPAELARLLGTYATRVLTPCGSTAVTGLELMTALRPPTRAVKDPATGNWVSGPMPGSLTEAVECAPPEAPDGHPAVAALYPRFHQRTPDQVLDEEAYQWSRPLTDAECMKSYVVGIDVNMAFAAAANRLTVGLSAPVHVHRPLFDAKLPGSWLVDLSHIRLDERLPSPFTPHGERPTGPAWYATPTVAYAVELGYPVTPLEAYLRYEHGPYLDAWYTRLRDAYVATMADLGITPGMPAEQFLAAMAGHQHTDPVIAAVLSAIKATVKGGLGKLRERARSGGWRPGEPWPALARPTWRPDIRAAVIAGARINMHRKMLKLATHADLYPVAILSDCAVYPSDGPSPLDFLPYRDGKPLPGTFRLGVSPGMVKHEGTQSVLWAEGLLEEHGPDVNIARHIKTGIVAGQDEGE
ncbi:MULTISPECIES: telomere-associated protein Tap [unclassified Streptomyces]|uniref:telomere-associated protein Tap n=1 Tax=unclassified Streptomyces TaxID=2593676 RepID=UPI000F6D5DBE|nr:MULTISPECIES: helix-turn-helix transcriptional regulator [unclassified Streptomyces]AZM64297.1 transcriptional regulator [Streptomyces sp. WAC 01438]RSM99070.1 transcriptional regulator [Streptomyces sp. WAC 01420]